MARLQERIAAASRALLALEEVMAIRKPSRIEQDAAIQRFEFTFETVWKAAQLLLRDVEGLDTGSPKGVIRDCLQIGLIDEQETVQALKMADDRNLTVHTYNEVLADEIYEHIKEYVLFLSKWLSRIAERAENI
ncbi:MAG: nucleotidyltransferase [Firmicutes bacterium HGW-Firmicutes-15]|nr:MAG: nucleotidyltransferase [Firmicutes bacterium HGW-Firmicutes-15]